MARTQLTARDQRFGIVGTDHAAACRQTPGLHHHGELELGQQFAGIFAARQVTECGTAESVVLEQAAERELVAHAAHRVGGIARQAETLGQQGRKLHSRIVHRQHRVGGAVHFPQHGFRRLRRLVEMQRHDGREPPGRGQLVAVVARGHDLHAQLCGGRKKVVVAVAGGGQKEQHALHGESCAFRSR